MHWLQGWTEPSVLASLIVAAAAIWYTIETQRLRETAVKQLVLMRQSLSTGLLPFVLAGIRRLSMVSASDKQEVQRQFEEWVIRRIELPGIGNRSITYNSTGDEIFEVTSTTDQAASHVFCAVYDHRLSAFRISPYQLEVIAPRESGFFPLSRETVTSDELSELIQKMYEVRGAYLVPYVKKIAEKHESVLLAIYFDIAGRLYATPRAVHWRADGTVLYGKSDLLQPVGFSDDFAPPFESTIKRIT